MLGIINNKFVMLWSIPFTFLLVVLELYIGHRQNKKYYSIKNTRDNILLGLIFAAIEAMFGGICILLLFAVYIPALRLAPQNIYLYWITLFFLEDLLYYTMHYLDHNIRLLWAGHVTHHSSEQFNFSVGVRAAIFEPVEKFIFFIPLAIIGYQPFDILLIYALSQTYGTLAHTRLIKKMGFLEYFMITPSHHRVHHAKNVKYLDKNFGMTIVLWDKLFGTFQKEVATIPIEYGIRKEKPYNNFIDVVTHEIRQIIIDCRQPIPFKQKLKYIFGKPGYSHDGSRQTAQQLREKEVRDSLLRKDNYPFDARLY